MMAPRAKILLIEGKRKNVRSFGPELEERNFHVSTVNTGRQMKDALASQRPDVIVMDSASYPSSGVRICKMARMMSSGAPLIYISAVRKTPPPSIRADISLNHPFTIRKLLNRVNQLLPSVDSLIFQVGPLTLNVDKRSLLKNHRERRLTPKQAHLLEVLMRHPGQVVHRSELMKRVWETDFLDDTRTLDVHIRWVREAVEDNPSKPRYITTVRGKGYQFAIPEEEAPLRP